MNFEVIQALQAACGGCVDPAIERDYIFTTEARQSSDALLKAIEGLPQVNELDDLRAASEADHERQGFINGFRMGVRLMSECTMPAPLDIYHPDERGNVTPIVPPWAREGK